MAALNTIHPAGKPGEDGCSAFKILIIHASMKNLRPVFVNLSLAAVLLCSTVQAAPGGNGKATIRDTIYLAPEIVVEADRITPQDDLFARSGFVASIDLGHSRQLVDDAAHVLSRTVGVRVRQYGGLGSFATASIRGSSSNHVQVYLDGVPINDAYSGSVNLADLPLGGLRSIEVYRGFSPPHLGSSAIGGTINLVTRGGEDYEGAGLFSHAEANASAGSFGSRRYNASLWAGRDGINLHCHGNYMESAGDFAFTDDNGTSENPLDDTDTTRFNNDFAYWNLFSTAELDVPHLGSASLSYNGFARDGGVPGIGSNQSVTARSGVRRHIMYLKLSPQTLASGRIHSSATCFYSRMSQRFRDQNGDITPARQETDNLITLYGSNVRAKVFTPLLPLALELFFEGRKERFHPVRLLPEREEGPDRLRESSTMVASCDLSLLGNRLVLTAEQRMEWYINEFYDEPAFPWLPPTPQGKVSGDEQTPHVGFRLHAAPFVTIKGNWGRYYRLPTFLELFGNLGSVTGKPDLQCESGTNRDIGLVLSVKKAWVFESAFMELAYLDNEVEDLILFFPNSQYTSVPGNIGSAAIRGWELSASSTVIGCLSISGNYSYLDTEDTSPVPYYSGNRLAGSPVHKSAIMLELDRERYRMAYELHILGSNYLDRANLEEVPAREIHNVSLRLETPLEGLFMTIECRNLSDNQVSDISGFPLPGRSYYATASYNR